MAPGACEPQAVFVFLTASAFNLSHFFPWIIVAPFTRDVIELVSTITSR